MDSNKEKQDQSVRGSVKNCILMVLNPGLVELAKLPGLMDALVIRGFDPLILTSPNPSSPDIQLFNLDNLPEIELDNLRQIVKDYKENKSAAS